MYKAIPGTPLPETAYANDSGGNPEAIPLLTYEQFRAFIRLITPPRTPAGSSMGIFPTTEHLTFLEEMLSGFNRVKVIRPLKVSFRWSTPPLSTASIPWGRMRI